jgi:hypothetical protein
LHFEGTGSKVTVYGHHLTFLDFRAHSFARITLAREAHMQLYLVSLAHSLCLPRHAFASLTLHAHAHFNLTTINGKSATLLRDSFANLTLHAPTARLHIGLYIGLANTAYREFLRERHAYKNCGRQAHYAHMFAPPFPDPFYRASPTDLSSAQFYRYNTKKDSSVGFDLFYFL